MKDLDRRPGEMPDVRLAVDDSLTYSLTIGLIGGIVERLVLRYTPTGDLLASIDPSPKKARRS